MFMTERETIGECIVSEDGKCKSTPKESVSAAAAHECRATDVAAHVGGRESADRAPDAGENSFSGE